MDGPHLSVHSSGDEYLSHIHPLSIVDNAAMNVGVKALPSTFFCIYSEVAFLDYRVILF